MSKWDKLIEQILRGRSDANIPFADLCGLLEHLGFERRTRGSHIVFRRQDVAEKPNLQRSGSNAKPYQVRQVRDIILKYKLGDDT
jgi:predicted RNA binding protein YcfA (HicA-like mRNA interferase family)